MNFNRIILVGRLTRDPELRTTPDGISVVRFTLAVDRGGRAGEERQADFFDIVAFRQLADTVANYMTKGRLVLVEGKMQSRTYTDREGTTRKVFEVVADTVRFLERARDTETPPREYTEPMAPTAPAAAPRTVQPAAPPAAPAPTPESEFPNDYNDIDYALEDLEDIDEDPFR
ncbi:MAG: single-stranded DNA-binding protein [Armatimonadetes bacterium JP3_11]|jgi:single-strand DNA-binding protein|nr:MAG: single-stranded DNA-binding protein [Armatimonadetes bacterium CP1_7O]OYT75294.1 MAG: single-stranded DNA-binding protein [Armatimonadetes bacterium JP3_11]RMH09657.1 MAG: single-stranded DNA-binding protein [Armatimonadota bacterium]